MRTKIVLLVGLGGAVNATAARADYREWLNVCMPGAFQACASVSLRAEYDPTTETTALRLTVANLQGSGGLPNPGQYAIDNLRIGNMTAVQSSLWDDPHGIPRNLALNWQSPGGVRGPYEPFRPQELNGSYWDVTSPYLHASWLVNDGLWGCDAGGRSWSTWMCGGYLEYTFTFAGLWDLTDGSNVRLQFSTDDSILSCTTGVDCISVTPEPITLVLLASGIAGLGGARALRRRRTARSAGV